MSKTDAAVLKGLARLIIGKNPLEIERIWQDLYFWASYNITGGAEMRVISAINIAQWDLLGKYLDAPVYQLLGGKVRNKIRVYNTTGHGRIKENWTNQNDIEKITRFLLDRGITGMKIWPFDDIARRNNGSYISRKDIEKNLDWIKRIRDTAGDDMEIAVEFHAHWNLPCSQRIARAMEPYNIMWLEDMMQPENVEAYATLAAGTPIPIEISERLSTDFPYLKFLEARACNIVMFDVTWCGGITSAKKISDLADVFQVPVTPHTYGGPILWNASIHVAAAVNNLYIMESGFHKYTSVYPQYLNSVIVPEDGFVQPSDKPGLGISVNRQLFKKGEATAQTVAQM